MLEMQKRSIEDKKAWWNKLKTMSEQEMKLMPYGFLKKYGSMLHFMRRMEQEAHVSENKEYRDYYSQVKNLNKLLVDEEKLKAQLKKQTNL